MEKVTTTTQLSDNTCIDKNWNNESAIELLL